MSAPEEVLVQSPALPKTIRPLRPRDAATLVIYDFENGAVRLLMGRRRMDQAFLPGHYVFPGGRVDRSDLRTTVATPLDFEQETNLMIGMGARASRGRAKALALAAIRETFEETGYVVGEICDTTLALGGRGRHAGMIPALAGLVYFCRAITPPGRPRRYDTRFFAVPRSRVSGPHAGGDGELEDIGWRTLDEVRGLKLPSITRLVLEDIGPLLAAEQVLHAVGAGRSPLTRPLAAGIPFYFQRNGVFQRVLLSRNASAP